MEAVLLFLAQSLASGAIGHYVSKGLKKIDRELPVLLQNDSDLETVAKIVSSKGLEAQLRELAAEVKKISAEQTGNVIQFVNSSNNGIVANKVEIKSTNKKVTIAAPAGTIASDASFRNYAKYLIDRYHKFKEAEVGKGQMRYTILYSAVKREFGAKWDMIPLGKADELFLFLQLRIDRTIVGKNNKANGKSSYSTFAEYAGKYS
jgi:hypothetical protein